MTKFQIPDGFGYAAIEVGGASTVLDLWEANNAYFAIKEKHGEDLVAVAEAWREWLVSKGFPRLSHGAAFKVAECVFSAVAELKKKDPPSSCLTSPDSAASTGSPPSG